MDSFYEAKMPKKAQVTLFVILAVLIVAGVGLVIYTKVKPVSIPAKLQPVENSFLDCVNNLAVEGAAILGEQGGYIYAPEAELGNDYAPFGSQLNFFGSPVPYWLYVSPNSILKEKTPTLQQMQADLDKYLQEQISTCTFETFIEQGYEVKTSDSLPKAKSVINDRDISVKIDYPITITFGETTKRVASHTTKINSNLGALYKKAKEIYEGEQKDLFLENYAIDVITLNAPTTGGEVTCAPKIWFKDKVESDVKLALQDNMRAVKVKGTYYTLTDDKDKYFVYDTGKSTSNKVVFFYSSLFPTKFEVWPSSEEGVMQADPIGMQQGLSVLGLCYVQYHFVYSLSYPVLVQVYDENDNLFQFPVVVVIDKNVPRKSNVETTVGENEAEICKNKVEDIVVLTKDAEGNALESSIQYKCSNTLCDIGKTSIAGNEAELDGKFPQCVNGFVIASSENHADAKAELSTNEPASIELILYPYHSLDINPKNLNLQTDEMLLITFTSDDYTASAIYPEQKQIKLVEGIYDVDAKLFKKGSIKLESENVRKCIKVPDTGIGGLFGAQREDCYDMSIPAQEVEQVIAGGGKAEFSCDETELKSSTKLSIDVPQFDIPKTVVEMQDNFNILETSAVNVELS